jgi:hypothetical protein
MRVQVLFDPYKKSVLIHGIINVLFPEIQQYFICQHKRWQLWLFKDLKIEAQQIADPIYESGFPCSLVIRDLLDPSLFIPESLRDLYLTVAGVEKELLVDPVLVSPNVPSGLGRGEPGMGIANSSCHFLLDPEIRSNP